MKVTEIKFLRRKGLPNYSHVEYQLTATPEAKQDPAEAMAEIEALVAARFDENVSTDNAEVETQAAPEPVSKKKTSKKTSKKVVEPEPEETEEEDETEAGDEEETETDEESEETSEDESEDEQSEEEEEVVAPKSKPSSKQTASKKSEGQSKQSPGKSRPKLKNTVYDRKNAIHKNIIGEMLNEEFPNFRKDTVKADKAVSVSKSMAGKEILDEEGELLEDFRAEFIKLMKAKAK